MQLQFEDPILLIQGRNPQMVHLPDDTSELYYVNDEGSLMQATLESLMGNWAVAQVTETQKVSEDHDITYLFVTYISREHIWFIWESDNRHRIAAVPDNMPTYVVDDPYRLFYSTDTDKLFININQNWRFIASRRHELLTNIGTKSHEELETLIASMQLDIQSLMEQTKVTSIKVQGESQSLTGDVVLIVGDGISMIQDTENKTITFSVTPAP